MFTLNALKSSALFLLALAGSGHSMTSYRTVYEFDEEAWVENIAVRANGDLLVTLLERPEVWSIDPCTSAATLVHNFTSPSSFLGIAEVTPDVFAVAGGNISEPETFAVWTVDLNTSPANVSLITEIPEGLLLNGMTRLSERDQTVLVGDSYIGTVFRVDVRAGTYEAVLEDETMMFPPGNSSMEPALNGLRIRDGYLYYLNYYQGLLGRVRINEDGTAAGAFEIVAENIESADDFAIDHEGNSYVAHADTITRVRPDGNQETILGGGNSSAVLGATSAQFGRKASDKRTLYVPTEYSRVVAVDIGGC